MAKYGEQDGGHGIGDGSSDRAPLPAHSFDPSQGSCSLRYELGKLRRMLLFAMQ